MGFIQNNTFGFGSNGDMSGGTVTAANNGLSLVGSTTVVLGQNVGQSGNPATLLSNREIPMAGLYIAWQNGISVFGGNAPTSTFAVQIHTTLQVGPTVGDTLSFASFNNAQLNLTTTATPYREMFISRSVSYDTDGLTIPIGHIALNVQNVTRIGGSISYSTDPNNSGSTVIGNYIRKRAGFTGVTTFTAGSLPSQATACIIARVDISQSGLSGGNTIVANGFYSGIQPVLTTNAFNTIENFIWANIGLALMTSGGTLTNAYGVYINPLPAAAVIKYAIYQEGANDPSYFNGQINIGSNTPISSAKVAITSTTQGFLPPRMTTTQRDAIASPATALLVYNTSTSKLNYFDSTWQQIESDFTISPEPSSNGGGAVSVFFGTDEAFYLGRPNAWASVVIGGVTYVMPLYDPL